MVFSDFFSSQNNDKQTSFQTAPVFDRLFALFIDFLVFGPLITLAMSALLKDFRTLAFSRVDSIEIEMIWFMLFAAGIALIVLLDAISVYFFRASPGQYFMQLRVVSWPTQERITLPQCLARSFLWMISLPLILPLMGVYTNPRRRAFHDRASETLVCTLKTNIDATPVEMERKFFSSWSHMFLLFILVIAMVGLFQLHHAIRSGVFHREQAQMDGALCKGLDASISGKGRLDLAIAGFLAGAWERDCLEKEADDALWRGQGDERELAHIAKGFAIEDTAEADPYFAKACEINAGSEACGIAKFVTSKKDEREKYLRKAGLTSLSARMLLLRESIARNELAGAAGIIQDLRHEDLLDSWLDREEVRTFWKMRDSNSKSRAPASAELNELLNEFKKRYDLP